MKLYYENPYLSEFDAVVTNCESAKGGFAVILDKTAFYPEGGGQPFDTGNIGGVNVTAVHERGGDILHYTDVPLEAGKEVRCKINWERRFPLMQGHTGEHILSGIIKKHYGLANVGFHMGSEFVTIDIDGALDKAQLEYAERLANRAVYENISVSAEFKNSAELESLDYRSKGNIAGAVRIVQIDEYDTCACCGIHCGSTGEVGVVKIVNFQKHKSGMRLFLLCGEHALADYAAKNDGIYEISRLLSAKPDEVSEAVRLLAEENANLRQSLSFFKNRIISGIAEKVPENSGAICLFENGLNPDELRRLCVLICERAKLAAVFSGADDQYKYAIGSKSLDVRKLTAALNEELSGRGGGKPELVQGSLTGDEKSIKATIDELYKSIIA